MLVRRSLSLRLFLIVFLSTHLPLISALAVYIISAQKISVVSLLVLLGATLAATVVSLFAIHRETTPIVAITDALHAFSEHGRVVEITHRSEDEIGKLATSAKWAIDTAERLLKEAQEQANQDPLTGVANRRALLQQVGASRGTIALIDIDRFKAVNDELGHLAGDEALKAVARLIRHHIRATDMVARWGGEEFAIHMPDTTIAQAEAIIDRLRETVAATTILPDRQITVSGGLYPVDRDLDVAIRGADRLLYQAKRRGRNRLVSARQQRA